MWTKTANKNRSKHNFKQLITNQEKRNLKMRRIEEVLEKVYSNKELRSSVVPLFIGDPGLGKTKIIEAFAKQKGAKLVELITSQMSPFEISGIAMPDKDTKKMTYYNFDKLETLKSGDILFFDELLNGNPVILNACLTILEQRTLISGKKLPNIMIVAAANPQGMVPITPQIKERFLWYNVKFDKPMWKSYMKKKYKLIPNEVIDELSDRIKSELFLNNNFFTPRSVDKALAMMARSCPTPYSDVLDSLLKGHFVINKYKKRKIRINKTEFINPGESLRYLDFLQRSKI